MFHSETIKKKYIDFFKSKNHIIIPNQSLIPENDPSTLFIIAGVHPIVPYILAGEHPEGKRLCNIQRCFRTIDIEETGDIRHLTFMEMLGNWSLGDYYKKDSLNWSIEFLTKEMGLDINKIFVTIFEGNNEIPRDDETIEIWKEIYKKYGINAEVYDKNSPNTSNIKIFPLSAKDNFWGPAGQTGPCGPSSEIYYYLPKEKADLSKTRPGFNDTDTFYEIWNNVFMQYNKTKEGKFENLNKHTVDCGMGFERLCLVAQNREENGSMITGSSMYDTDLFSEAKAYLKSLIEDESKKSTLKDNINKYSNIREFDPTLTDYSDIESAVISFRIILDHTRAITFLSADGVRPSNKDQGYILRRLLRRAVRHARKLGINSNFIREIAQIYIDKYKIVYPHLESNKDQILNDLDKEEINFSKTIKKGSKELDKLIGKNIKINGNVLFDLFETYGYPYEMAIDKLNLEKKEQIKIEKEFEKAQKEHQDLSRKGAEVKFKGGLADDSIETTRYHSLTHILLKALQIVLGDHVHQKGSNITAERLRFDFSHPEKLTDKQIIEVEKIINETISKNLVMEKKIMKKEEALKLGAEHEFEKTYPENVSVYILKDPKTEEVFSKEFCGGPHIKNTSEIAKAGKFKIIKQESVGAGVKRVKGKIIQ